MAEAKKIGKGKALLFKTILLASPFLLFFLVYYGLYFWKLSKLHGFWTAMSAYVYTHEEPDFEVFSQEQILNLGWAHTRKKTRTTITRYPASSYLFYSPEKKKNVYRIGLFGCSYIQGEEAGLGQDPATFLQKELKSYFPDSAFQIEVVNFGVSGYGWHQSYLLFGYLAKQYALDMAVLNMHEWHMIRDNTFAFHNVYLPVHARYILDDKDSLRLIAIQGGNRVAAAHRYRRFFQPSEFVKFDQRTPNYLQPIKSQGNPFYYLNNQSNQKDEILISYQRIIEGFAQQTPQVIVLANDSLMLSLKKKTAAPNAVFLDRFPSLKTNVEDKEPVQTLSRSFYTAPLGHLSAGGNLFRAQRWARLFVGDSAPIRYIHFKSMETLKNPKKPNKKWQDFQSVYFQINSLRIDTVFSKAANDYSWSLSQKTALNQLDAQALLLVSAEKSDLNFYALPFIPQDAAPIFLSYENENGQKLEIKIGFVEAKNPYFYEWKTLPADSIALNSKGLLRYDSLRPAPFTHNIQDCQINRLLVSDNIKAETFSIKMGDFTMPVSLSVQKERVVDKNFSGYLFFPENQLYTLRLKDDQFLDLDKLKPSFGSFDIVFEGAELGFRFPVLKWQVSEWTDAARWPQGEPPLKRFLKKTVN